MLYFQLNIYTEMSIFLEFGYAKTNLGQLMEDEVICSWQIVDRWNGPFTLFPSADASNKKSITYSMFASDDQLILNGAGLWINAGRCELFLVQPNSQIYKTMKRLKFIKTRVILGQDSFACNECRHSWGVKLASNGASFDEIMIRFADCNSCKCTSIFTTPFKFTNECPVCLIDQELIKFTNCIHGVCEDVLDRLDKCPVCRSDIGDYHTMANMRPSRSGHLLIGISRVISYIESGVREYEILMSKLDDDRRSRLQSSR